MSEREDWKATADDMFASFGDVIRPAQVISYVQGIYNRNTGVRARTPVTTDTVAVRTGKSREFIQRGAAYAASSTAFMVKGSPFSAWPEPDQTFILDPGTDAERSYVIKEVTPDEAGIGAYFVLYVVASGER